MKRAYAFMLLVWLAISAGAGAAPSPPTQSGPVADTAPARPVPAANTAPTIPFKRDAGGAGPGSSGALGLLAAAMLGLGALWYVRQRLQRQTVAGGQPGLLRILETRRLGAKATLSVVEFDGGLYLVANSEQGVSCLVSKAGCSGADA